MEFKDTTFLKFIFIMTLGFACAVFLYSYLPYQMISPGYVGVVVDLFGSDKGVEHKTLGVGLHFVAPWKQIYLFPVFEQNDAWHSDEGFVFQTCEGMSIKADIGVNFYLEQASIPKIFQRYRRGIYEISHYFLRNFIRDAFNKAASKLTVESLYNANKEHFFLDVENHVRNDLKDMGIIIRRIYLIGQFHFPDNVSQAINASIEANQKAQQRENELRQSEAEAKKMIAQTEGEAECIRIKAHAEAESNKMLTSSLSAALLEWQKIQKWDGKLPHVTGAHTPFIKI